jgi:membrane protein YdbS with pleckstrin-like domain
VVFTAGHRGAIITIPALDADEAEEIRDRLAAQSGVGDAV